MPTLLCSGCKDAWFKLQPRAPSYMCGCGSLFLDTTRTWSHASHWSKRDTAPGCFNFWFSLCHTVFLCDEPEISQIKVASLSEYGTKIEVSYRLPTLLLLYHKYLNLLNSWVAEQHCSFRISSEPQPDLQDLMRGRGGYSLDFSEETARSKLLKIHEISRAVTFEAFRNVQKVVGKYTSSQDQVKREEWMHT